VTAVFAEVFDLGDRVEVGSVRVGGSEVEQVEAYWARFCAEGRAALKADGGDVFIPRLLGFERRGPYEVWRVGLAGTFGVGDTFVEVLPELLCASRGGTAAHGVMSEAGVLEIVVSHYRLPAELDLAVGDVPAERHRLFVGRLMDGSAGVFDFRRQFHVMLVGATGSGKTHALRAPLAQAVAKGWRLVLVSPKPDEAVFQPFVGHDRCRVITGEDLEHFEAVCEVLSDLREERSRRQKLMGEWGVSVWFDMPEEVLVGEPPVLLVMDEIQSFVQAEGWESSQIVGLKKQIRGFWTDTVRKGRSAGHHAIAATQTPTVDSFGGGEAMSQLQCRLVIRALDKQWWARVLPDSTADLRAVLGNPSAPFGRAINRGLVASGSLFGSDVVTDAPMQIASIPDEVLDEFLTGTPVFNNPEPVAEFEPVEPAPAEQVEAVPVRGLVVAAVAGFGLWLVVLLAGLVWLVAS
jgi:hypothetical protein